MNLYRVLHNPLCLLIQSNHLVDDQLVKRTAHPPHFYLLLLKMITTTAQCLTSCPLSSPGYFVNYCPTLCIADNLVVQVSPSRAVAIMAEK